MSCCSSRCPAAPRRRSPTVGPGPRDPCPSQLRFDRTTGQWVIIAALRQDRTYKPPPDQCPLCPGPTGLTSEVPALDYDVVVFENRFPSLSGAGGRHRGRPTGSCRCPGMAAAR
ncbi:galactose-1-phosphate uridyl transferase, N-terminal domain protein [Mycobacterium xenopi 3993]|nr:galactose-1-phosphate uridyl transferase, N-terminal domain protein [Mycobacterium xenopi 3993]